MSYTRGATLAEPVPGGLPGVSARSVWVSVPETSEPFSVPENEKVTV